eukprot:scaffold38728_cov56-Phaeocystis_antarctica.AAC.7
MRAAARASSARAQREQPPDSLTYPSVFIDSHPRSRVWSAIVATQKKAALERKRGEKRAVQRSTWWLGWVDRSSGVPVRWGDFHCGEPCNIFAPRRLCTCETPCETERPSGMSFTPKRRFQTKFTKRPATEEAVASLQCKRNLAG